jgi:hypothetical protein
MQRGRERAAKRSRTQGLNKYTERLFCFILDAKKSGRLERPEIIAFY